MDKQKNQGSQAQNKPDQQKQAKQGQQDQKQPNQAPGKKA